MKRTLSDGALLDGRGALVDRIVMRLSERPTPAFVLTGEPGVGKTRLAAEATRAASLVGFATAEVAATGSAVSIPFGPFAPLLPVELATSDRLELLRQASAAIAARAGSDGRLLLAVDDAHLLDEGSAALVNQLARSDACGVLLTVRTHMSAPDAVTALWKDGVAERVELGMLAEDEVGQLVANALGGPVDPPTVRRLSELSQGNAMYLLELVAGSVESGSLTNLGDIWSLVRPLAAPSRLIELVAARLEGMEAGTLEATRCVAVGEPLPLAVLEQLVGPPAIEDAERHGLIELHADRRRSSVRLAHPLYGETIRQTLSAYRLRQTCGRVAAALAGTGARRREDLLRLAQLQLDAGVGDGNPRLLTSAAQRALEMFDMELARRFAQRAVEGGAGVDAEFVLGESLFRLGRLQEAEALFARLSPRCTTDAEIARVAGARAYNLHTLIGDREAADGVLAEALAAVHDVAARNRLLARQAMNRVLDGLPEEALAAAELLLSGPDDATISRGTFVSSVCLALIGRSEEAAAMASRGIDAHRRAGLTTQVAECQLVGAALGHIASGELTAASDVADVISKAAVAAHDFEGEATAIMIGGFVLVERGYLEAAARAFLESGSINRGLNDVPGLRWCLGGLATAEGMRGNAEGAATAVSELDELRSIGDTGIYEFDVVERGRAWARVAGGEISAGVEHLRDAARRAAAAKQRVAEARLLHDVARLDDPGSAAPRLVVLATEIEGRMAPALAAHATALLSGSAPDIESAGLEFESIGASVLAAEAYVSAARGFRSARLLRREAAAARRAQALLVECGGARTPALRLDARLALLTRREREVAGLAARGTSSREIASRLFLSVRTVENHLQKAYTKLGVTGRAELEDALAALDAGSF